MYISKITIRNFRIFDEIGITAFFKKGVNAIISENNCGKTAIIDAMRIAFSTAPYKKDIYFNLVDWKDQMIVSISHQIDSGTIKPYDGKCAPDIIKIKSRDKKQPDFKEHRLIEYFEKRAETNYTLSSVHGVKGETFDATLLIVDSTRGANTLTPAVLNSGNLNTELIRIAYVAMTRPRKLLVVSVPKTKTTLSRFSTALWDYQEL